jgi:predicted nucleotide-binding protein
MATRRPQPVPPKAPLELRVSRIDAKQRIEERIEKGRELRQRSVGSAEALQALENDRGKWDAFNTEMLRQMFTNEDLASEYRHAGRLPVMIFREKGLGEKIADAFKDIEGKMHSLDSIAERLELIPLHAAGVELETSEQPAKRLERSNKVFVVHGHDEAAKTSLEVFLRELGLDPVVLHRQADEGLTVIEKFEKHSDVGYAFILLTPDEIAYLASEEAKPDSERQKEHRARPNVIFEFGYFVGKLSRSRVCCLYTGDVELPSDLGGLVYKRYDKKVEEVAWDVIKDLKAAGYSPG